MTGAALRDRVAIVSLARNHLTPYIGEPQVA
jgi:hypothetical protein